ncbi:MAG: phosphoribulokinase/uridine kinase [Actinoallomurus sp.]|nr:phosphoribulokinase/uridine kinase [Actinoallomurus sp.]
MKPVMLAIVGDSAAGKTTLTAGIVRLLGDQRIAVVRTDDYHRFDRAQRRELDITPLHPDCNHMDVMAQHLRLLAAGEPIMKPVYDHSTGGFSPPEYVAPRPFVVVDGLLGLSTKRLRECFSIKVFLDPPEELRRHWKVERDCTERGYTSAQVLSELQRREPDSAAFIRPQREWASLVVRFEPPEPGNSGFSARIVLRPTISHRDLIDVAQKAAADGCPSIRVALGRDEGHPADLLSIAGDIAPEETAYVESLLWERMSFDHHLQRDDIGLFLEGTRLRHSDSLAITQLFITYHLLNQAAEHAADAQAADR